MTHNHSNFVWKVNTNFKKFHDKRLCFLKSQAAIQVPVPKVSDVVKLQKQEFISIAKLNTMLSVVCFSRKGWVQLSRRYKDPLVKSREGKRPSMTILNIQRKIIVLYTYTWSMTSLYFRKKKFLDRVTCKYAFLVDGYNISNYKKIQEYLCFVMEDQGKNKTYF